jgi:cytochrome P450
MGRGSAADRTSTRGPPRPQSGLLVTDLQHLRYVMDKNQKNFAKDTELSYKPFLDILGTSIITSHGDRWRAHRNLLGPAFRVDILEETTHVAKKAADRLSAKLEKLRGTGKTIDMAEEFRVMTLEVNAEEVAAGGEWKGGWLY